MGRVVVYRRKRVNGGGSRAKEFARFYEYDLAEDFAREMRWEDFSHVYWAEQERIEY